MCTLESSIGQKRITFLSHMCSGRKGVSITSDFNDFSFEDPSMQTMQHLGTEVTL